MSDIASVQKNANKIRLELHTESEDKRPIYIAGNFNSWRNGDDAYKLEELAPGHYAIELKNTDLPDVLEYKYTRGSWEYVELDDKGRERPNRKAASTKHLIKDRVKRWRQDQLLYPKERLPIIEIISEAFEIPQRIRTRRIAALLPYDYYDNPDRRYPVLYLQDGQNLFDDYAPYGSWGVNKRLAAMSAEGKGDIIIISIDHAAEERIVEFTPSSNTRLGRGEGKKYVRFLADTLKPYIDKRYRTLTHRENTGIGGSSMGGLISIYAGMMYPEVYGRLMIFSPSLWVTPNIRFQLLNLGEPYSGRVYLYGGIKESASMVPSLERLKQALEQQAADVSPVFFLSIDPEGEHNENRWGEEFPHAISWLFFSEDNQ